MEYTSAKKIVIGFNGRPFTSNEVRGISRHTHNLINAIHRQYPEVQINIYSDIPLHQYFKEEFFYANIIDKKMRPHIFWEQIWLPLKLHMDGVDLYHSTTNIGIPYLIPCASILTIHDLFTHEALKISKKLLSLTHWKNVLVFIVSWLSSKRADKIITVSKYSEKQILKVYPELASKTSVVYNGVDSIFFQQGQASSPREKYFLYVGGFEYRKNIPTLINAFLKFQERMDEGYTLILAGNSNGLSDEMLKIVHQYPAIKLTGFISDQELVKLYAGSISVIIPSFYEGFGLQVLEAMAAGTAVLSSNTTSLPEVAGNAALFFDPNNEDELVAGMEKMANDDQVRSSFVSLGTKRAKDFSWDIIAKKTMRIYESALSRD